jgi:hypothetical protein
MEALKCARPPFILPSIAAEERRVMEDNKGSVFAAYSGEDQPLAEALVNLLLDNGFRKDQCFSADEIASGLNWSNEISKNLGRANHVVVVLTPDSLTSPWVWAEVGYAHLGPAPVSVHGLLLDVKAEDVKVLAPLQMRDGTTPKGLRKFLEGLHVRRPVNLDIFLNAWKHHRSVNHYRWSPLCNPAKTVANCAKLVSLKMELEERNEAVRNLLDELSANVQKKLAEPFERTEGLHRLAENEGVLWIGQARSPEVNEAWKRLYAAICDVGSKKKKFCMMGNGLKAFFVEELFESAPRATAPSKRTLSTRGKGLVDAMGKGMEFKVLLLDPGQAPQDIDYRLPDEPGKISEQFTETIAAIRRLNSKSTKNRIDVWVTPGPLHRSLTYLHREIEEQKPVDDMLVTHYVHGRFFNESYTVVLHKHNPSTLMQVYLQEFERLFKRASKLDDWEKKRIGGCPTRATSPCPKR